MRLRTWVVGVGLVGALAACGGDTGSADRAQPDASATTATTASPAAPSASASAGVGAGSALLTLADLPAGWMEVANGDDEGGSNACLDALTEARVRLGAAGVERATFSQSELGPFLAAAVVARAADEVLPELDRALAGCDGTTSPAGFTSKIQAVALPGAPDGSLAVEAADTNASGTTIRYTVAAAGTDEATAFVVVLTPLGEVDKALVATSLRTMRDRLPGT